MKFPDGTVCRTLRHFRSVDTDDPTACLTFAPGTLVRVYESSELYDDDVVVIFTLDGVWRGFCLDHYVEPVHPLEQLAAEAE